MSQLVVSVGKDPEHSVAVFHWQSRTTLFTAPSGAETVLGCHMVQENLFVTCGVDHLRLWSRFGGTFELDQGDDAEKRVARRVRQGASVLFVWVS